MRIISQTKELRRYEPETVKDRFGNEIEMTLCEELDTESSRWEETWKDRAIDEMVVFKSWFQVGEF